MAKRTIQLTPQERSRFKDAVERVKALVRDTRRELWAEELKRRGEKPSDDQEDFAAAGYPCEWTDSFDVALAILKRWGALRTGISA